MSTRKKIIITIVLLTLLAALILALRPSPVPVDVATAERGAFVEYVEDEGRTWLRDTYVVSALIGGYLHRVDLEPGDAVAAGDTVFVIEPLPAPGLDARTRQQAEESVAAARARLESAMAERDSRRSEARLAERDFDRISRLAERDTVSQSELERAELDLERARLSASAAEAAVDAARHELDNARAVLEVADGARSEDAERTVKVVAPVGGVVVRRQRCCEGVVQAGEDIIEIGDLDELEIRVDLLSMDAVRVRPGMRVVIERWGGNEPLEGRVRRVEPAGFMRISALGVEEQRVPVLVEITSDRELWEALGTDYRIEARIILWEGDAVLSIPTSALFRIDDRWHVYVVEDGRARLRAVERGRRSGLVTQINDGLAAGEDVVTHPGDRISDGARVAVP